MDKTQVYHDEMGILDRYFAAALQGALASRRVLGKSANRDLVQECFELATEGVRQRREILSVAVEAYTVGRAKLMADARAMV